MQRNIFKLTDINNQIDQLLKDEKDRAETIRSFDLSSVKAYISAVEKKLNHLQLLMTSTYKGESVFRNTSSRSYTNDYSKYINKMLKLQSLLFELEQHRDNLIVTLENEKSLILYALQTQLMQLFQKKTTTSGLSVNPEEDENLETKISAARDRVTFEILRNNEKAVEELLAALNLNKQLKLQKDELNKKTNEQTEVIQSLTEGLNKFQNEAALLAQQNKIQSKNISSLEAELASVGLSDKILAYDKSSDEKLPPAIKSAELGAVLDKYTSKMHTLFAPTSTTIGSLHALYEQNKQKTFITRDDIIKSIKIEDRHLFFKPLEKREAFSNSQKIVCELGDLYRTNL